MPTLNRLLQQRGIRAPHRPWPRAVVSEEVWRHAGDQLAQGRWTLLDLWGDAAMVHMALLEEESAHIAVMSLDCTSGSYPSIGHGHAPAIRLERAIHDLFGFEPLGLPDRRPWLDHGRWGLAHPLGVRRAIPAQSLAYSFLAAEGEGLHQIPVGPVHAGIIEPGHFRFTANGETVVRLEERFGYVHKGIESLMADADLERATRLAGRVSGDSTVAYAFAFARAVEAASNITIPARAIFLRALMAELERLANHFGDIGAICNDAAFAIMHAHCGILRERVLRAADACFGHRLMMDRVVPGGVAANLDAAGASTLYALIGEIRKCFPALVALYDDTASLQDRMVNTGRVAPHLVRQYGAGGFVGRASGRTFDVRRALSYPPYDGLRFDVVVRDEGDVNARVWIRIREVEESLSLIEQILQCLPEGPVRVDPSELRQGAGEGAALVEGFRGDIWVWVRLGANGRIERCRLRDPSWFQWPLLEAAIEGNIVADFPLCNKSFNCSYSGHDL